MARNFIKGHCHDPNYFAKVASQYSSSVRISIEKVAEINGISTDNVKTSIRLAIIMYLIPYADCVAISTKADENQQMHYNLGAPKKRTRASLYYDDLFKLRKKNIIKGYTDEEIRHVVDVYLQNPKARNVWEKMGLSKEEMNGVLKKGCIFGVISDDEFAQLREVSLSKARFDGEAAAIKTWLDHVASYRNTRKGILDNIEKYTSEQDKDKLATEQGYLEWFDKEILEAIS